MLSFFTSIKNILKKMKQHSLGIFIYLIIFLLILYILTRKEQSVFMSNFSMINEFFTSLVLVVAIIISFFIYLTNRNIIPTNFAINMIKRIPNYVPFNKFIKQTLLALIDEKYKIIVLLRTLDKNNYKLNLSQIAAFNQLNKQKRLEGLDIEYLFIDNNSSDIEDLIENLDLVSSKYIIITSLSNIFKQTILARENLPESLKSQIKIIGALSSISDEDIQKIIDNDSNIIRIFPPDYDEAKTAMEFLFSKIKSSLCIEKYCKSYFKPSNIIILHNGTYGEAVAKKCKLFFEKERSKLYYYTSKDFTPTVINENIKFYSFDFNDKSFINDEIKSNSFLEFSNKWTNSRNYYYIVGYEPNISYMLKNLKKFPNEDITLLFCATLSMNSWKRSVIETLKEQPNLEPFIKDNSFYIKLLIDGDLSHTSFNNGLTINLFYYNPSLTAKKEPVNLETVIQKIFSLNREDTKEFLRKYYNRNNNYISLFSAFSIEVAKYTIERKCSLLESKAKVLQNYQRKISTLKELKHIDILVNGDSINQYTIERLVEE